MIGTLITGRVSIGAGANSTAKNGLATAIRYAEQRVNRLTYLSSSIRNLADNMLSIQRAKLVYKREQS